ncbi:MAG: FAD-dependent oxidoreductase [Magnetococcales bacterium]|nr:FAD-dependent oxidoreductase [Magnetococcales bacterium]
MSEPITITLNGQSLQVDPQRTIREVAEAHGASIPTFCYDDRLKPFASCFLCVVEVEKARGLVPACSTRVAPNMVIHTDSERVHASRRMALDLLLSDHAGDCIAPCEATCPANIDIQGYIAHIANGQFDAAVRLIKERNPLPVVCGRICPHPCESQCRRGLVDEPVAINPLKRFASEYEISHGPFVGTPAPDSGHKVAIIGGGPAGLSAAHYLRLAGHAVEIFEALPSLGGMARYGIPRFRLPWELMDKEIRTILDLGVTVHHNQRLGRDFTLTDLKARGFGAILLAIGAHLAKPMRIENEDVPGVIGGVDFLRKAVLGEPIELGEHVVVIGGGDTAMDCARVARRLGAQVTLVYRRTQAEMPALPQEQEECMEEGVEFRFLTAPTKVQVGPGGRARGLQVITMELGEPDESGRRRPVPLVDSEEDIDCDLVVAAIGQDPDLSCLEGEPRKPGTTRWKTIVYDEKTQVTSLDGVFAAGDCSFGPDILIRAIGEGRRAAMAMHLYLQGSPVTLTKPYAISRGRLEELEMADFSPRYVHKKRALETTLEAEERLHNGGWGAINIGLNEAQALAEASRCIECGCNARFDCDLRRYATEYDGSEARLKGDRRCYDEDKRHPLIRIEGDKCITCGSCVRLCNEVRQINALAFINRGFVTRIGPNFDDPLQDTGCDACGMCMDVCPTGTLSPNTGKEAGPWKWQVVETTCTACSLACGLAVHVAEGRVVKVTSIAGDPVNGAVICAEGRFAWRLLAQRSPARGEAVATVAEQIAKAGNLAVVVSARAVVEELYAASLLARSRGGQLYYVAGDRVRPSSKPAGKIRGEANLAFLKSLGAKPWPDQASADVLVLVNTSLGRLAPTGARLVVLSSQAADSSVDHWLPVADPLEYEGCLLDREGRLARLRPALNSGERRSAYAVLAGLIGDASLQSLTGLRQALVAEVPAMQPVLNGSGGRIGASRLLEPELMPVGADLREMAFSAHMSSLALAWE